ncbi:MAG: hypothetical protein DME99_00955, partial [Verrucomicrobia bacterium]
LFEGQNFLARQPLLQLVRHAVSTALVATVRNRDPQIGNPMAVVVLHSDCNLTVNTMLNQETETVSNVA